MTGLDKNRLLSSLGPQEVVQLCEALQDWYVAALDTDRYERGYCTLEALDEAASVDGGVVSVDVAACEAATSLCVADEVPLLCFDCSPEQPGFMAFDTCDATVGTYENCTTALLRDSSFVESYTCESAARLLNESLQESLANPDGPLPIERVPECAAYLAACPLAE